MLLLTSGIHAGVKHTYHIHIYTYTKNGHICKYTIYDLGVPVFVLLLTSDTHTYDIHTYGFTYIHIHNL